MIPAVIDLAFDPILRVGEASFRLETVALAGVLLLTLLVAARIATVTTVDGPYVPPLTLRPDDLLFLALGSVPGAVVGGRLGYVLLHADYYAAHPSAIVDPAQGSLELSVALLGGLATALVIARMIGAPVGRWMHAATLPLLFALAAGKFVTILGADGQGQPTDLPWATRFVGPGPWGSLGADIASHPSQVYEAIATVLVLLVVGVALRSRVFRRRDGSVLFGALGAWAIGRAIAVFTWRDTPLVGAIRAEHVILLGVVVVSVVGAIGIRGGLRSRDAVAGPSGQREVEWPDPERRPTF